MAITSNLNSIFAINTRSLKWKIPLHFFSAVGLTRFIVFFLSLLTTALPLHAQILGQWKSYTSFNIATSIAVENDSTLWVGTEGGLYRYRTSSGTFKTFTNTEGLPDTRVTAVMYDSIRKGLWVGFESGVLGYFDTQRETTEAFFDLSRITDFPSKSIRDLVIQGDTLWVATDFGIALFLPLRKEFKESYTRFGSFPSGTAVRRIAFTKTHLFAATASGVARASLSSLNLLAPSEWQNISGTSGARDLLIKSDSLFATGDFGTSFISGTSSQFIRSGAAFGLFINSTSPSSEFLILTSNGLLTRSGTFFSTDFAQYSRGAVQNNFLWIADKTLSLRRLNLSLPSSPESLTPNAPKNSRFDIVRVDGFGRVWGSSASENRGATGFSRLELNGVWKNYDNFRVLNSQPIRQFNDVLSVGEKTYISTWGGGIFEFDSFDSVKVFNNTTGDFTGIPSDTSFVVLAALGYERRSNLIWAPSLGTRSNPIYAFSPEQSRAVKSFGSSGLQTEIPTGANAFGLFVTSDGRKWIILREGTEVGRGIAVFDDRRTLESLADDRWYQLTTQPNFGGLPDSRINAIAEDLDGTVWLATDRGAASFFSSSDVGSISLSSFDPYPRGTPSATTVFELRSEALTGVVVDAANRKWFSSPNGIWVLSANGTSIEAQFTTANSPLLSNTVRSISYNSATGTFYFATDRGLSAFTTSAVRAASTIEALFVYPNPYRLPSASPLTIRGLAGNATVKILSFSGALVREIGATPAGAIQWDGKDQSGQWVASGIYLAVAVSADGKQGGVGKIAVIRTR
ncbi:MAG: hypothetical protein SFU91_13875 [Chloroherpetonaceae bacterium]|nr:hypothetical protein [Chloroherpetonaceae bacterium]